MVIHKRVFTPLRNISTVYNRGCQLDVKLSNWQFQKILRPDVKFSVKAIVEFEEWLTTSIIRVERSQRGVKTILWITKNYRINYEKALLFNEATYDMFRLTHCTLEVVVVLLLVCCCCCCCFCCCFYRYFIVCNI